MNKYILTHKDFEGCIELAYDADDIVSTLISSITMQPHQLEWVLRHVPVLEQPLVQWAKRAGFEVDKVKADLSFEAFWAVWCEQKINKKEAEAVWNKMTIEQKVRVFKIMPAYRRWCARNPYKNSKAPDAWLRQQRYMNDYDKMK
ncbi:MAG: hypothetical protein R2800_09945 [Flavipsychrobacter sp.]